MHRKEENHWFCHQVITDMVFWSPAVAITSHTWPTIRDQTIANLGLMINQMNPTTANSSRNMWSRSIFTRGASSCMTLTKNMAKISCQHHMSHVIQSVLYWMCLHSFVTRCRKEAIHWWKYLQIFVTSCRKEAISGGELLEACPTGEFTEDSCLNLF